MTKESSGALDPLLHQPTRTQIVAFLCAREEASFSELKELTGVTDGNLDAHMKKLIQNQYINARKAKQLKRMITFYSLTDTGHAAFKDYIASLQKIIDSSKHL
ncbi:MAG: transcriptional regulator [Arenicella sp.]